MPSVPDEMIVPRPVAVIDIGSNTIKLLVAVGPGLQVIQEAVEETRIGSGIGRDSPRLSPESMTAGLESVGRLWEIAARYHPGEAVITATSAVRDAENGQEFLDAVENITGIHPRMLTGSEEAHYIGTGVAQDPHIKANQPFYLMDLGGGSLELLEFHGGAVRQKVSLQLGAVRLAEKLLKDPDSPISDSMIAEIQEYVTEAVAVSDFSFHSPGGLVGTGGAMTHARFLIGAEKGFRPEQSPPLIELAEMRALQQRLCSSSMDERLRMRGLPASRADIMPIAVVTLTTIMELATSASVIHSFYNLRFGLAAELIAKRVKDLSEVVG